MGGPEVYVVTDAEFDGPTPGRNSLLSFASIALAADGQLLGEFEAVLQPLPQASPDPFTLAWFRGQPEAWAAATRDPQPPEQVMPAFVAWVRSLPGLPVFAAHPLALDGAWLDYYLQRFTAERLLEGPWRPDRLFKAPGLCIASCLAGRLGRPMSRCDVRHYPAHWLGDQAHSHRALDDARGYAALLGKLLTGAIAPP